MIPSNCLDLRRAFENGSLDPVDVTEHYIQRQIETRYANHTVTTCFDLARLQANEASMRYKTGGTLRMLEGIPIVIKDLFCTKGIRTTAGSKVLESFVPDYESVVTQKLLDAGAIVLGKTNMDEFAMGATTKYSCFGPAINRIDGVDYVAGGSSGGSALAVSTNSCVLALGSDTGGSVRQPAAFCGVVGLRPTYGRCSRRGMIAFSSSLDQAGAFAQDVMGAAILTQCMMGYDKYDSTTVDMPVPDLLHNSSSKHCAKRIGVITDSKVSHQSIKDAYKHVQEIFGETAVIEPVELKYLDYAMPIYYVLAPVEAASNMARYSGIFYSPSQLKHESYQALLQNNRARFGDEVKRRILLGNFVSGQEHYEQYYKHAKNVQYHLKQELYTLFDKYDVLISPTVPHTAFGLTEQKDPIDLYNEDYYTSFVNLTGCCGISVPVGIDAQSRPIGMQIIAKPFAEQMLVDTALYLEEHVNRATVY